MGRINITREFSLDGLDDGWTEEHFVKFNNFKFKDLAKFRKLGVKDGSDDITEENLAGILDIVKQKFVEGKVFIRDESVPVEIVETEEKDEDGEFIVDRIATGTTEPAESDDLDDLPAGIVGEIVEWAMGKLNPKSKKSLRSPSSTKDQKATESLSAPKPENI